MPFIVSGCWRTGTSAMMAACEAGGMEIYAHPFRDEHMNRRLGDEYYKPNERYLEPHRRDFADPSFPREHTGKLIKVLFGGVGKLAVMEEGYRWVFMRRAREEIRQSWEALNRRYIATFQPAWFLASDDDYERVMDEACALIRNRKDTVSLHEIRFREDLIADPERVFTTLARDGWPLDPYAAAATIDAEQCRFKLEELEVGI